MPVKYVNRRSQTVFVAPEGVYVLCKFNSLKESVE